MKWLVMFLELIGFGLTESEKEDFKDFQKNRRPSMSVVGRGTLIMSLDDAHAARKEKTVAAINREEMRKHIIKTGKE